MRPMAMLRAVTYLALLDPKEVDHRVKLATVASPPFLQLHQTL